ncbi:MAG: hypothetical protein J7496_09085 [Novosphingobium sp.]|nr:hypothetical protein [Novosphingobium sp.]
MPIDTNFSFHHLHTGQPGALVKGFIAGEEDYLGLLRGLAGTYPAHNPQRKWKGSGFNMIWRPNFANASGSQPHFLQLNMTNEELSFTEISGSTGIANRGLLQEDIFLGGATYLQTIADSFDNTDQHFEVGVFNRVPPTTDPAEPETVTRLGTIPHGTTINLQGTAFVTDVPQIAAASITPFGIGSPDDGQSGLVHFPEEVLANALDSRTDLARVASLDQAHLANPNLFLLDALAGQTITRTTVILLSSDSAAAGAVPDAGGGVDNIAFLKGKAAGPNAVAPKVTAIFWIEEGQDADGSALLQLQYTQRVLLDFGGLSWPHITVGTLRPA